MQYGVIHSSWACHGWNTRYCHLYCRTSISEDYRRNTVWGRHCGKHITMKCVHVMIGCQINLAKYLLVVSSVCVCVGGGQGRAQGRALYLYQQPQLLGTKALLLKDHVTVCVCVCVHVPPLSCDLVLRAGSEKCWVALREVPSTQGAGRQAGRQRRWMVGWMDGQKSDRWGVWETES